MCCVGARKLSQQRAVQGPRWAFAAFRVAEDLSQLTRSVRRGIVVASPPSSPEWPPRTLPPIHTKSPNSNSPTSPHNSSPMPACATACSNSSRYVLFLFPTTDPPCPTCVPQPLTLYLPLHYQRASQLRASGATVQNNEEFAKICTIIQNMQQRQSESSVRPCFHLPLLPLLCLPPSRFPCMHYSTPIFPSPLAKLSRWWHRGARREDLSTHLDMLLTFCCLSRTRASCW